MGLNHNRATSRPDKAPKQTLTHSFTFSTPENPRNTPGRKRARTLDYPPDSDAAHEAAKVKGGHSLRKRARIDYAQMNDDNEEDQPFKEIAEDQTEITVSGVRSARKRRSTVDPKYDEEENQPSPLNPSIKRGPRSDKQRTVSPKPQRRKPQQRKSTSATLKPPLESPEQQPSDTELKDTIEVGAPLAMQFTGSSSSQHSEAASSISGQSPLKKNNAQQHYGTGAQVASPTAIQQENGITTIPSGKDKSTHSAMNNAQSPIMKHEANPTVAEHSPADVDEKEEMPKQSDMRQQLNMTFPSVSEIANPQVATQFARDRAPEVFQSSLATMSLPESSQADEQPSSQETVDSDATVDMPPDRPVITSALATQLRNTISSVAEEQSTDRRRKLSQPGTVKRPEIESRQEEPEDVQETPKTTPRTRRRSGRLPENTIMPAEESSQMAKEKERTMSTTKKAVKAQSDSARDGAPTVLTPQSPETPKKRRPGRPPKIRQSIEEEPQPARRRRSIATAQTIQQPRPIRSRAPRDFSFLTPYTQAREIYPENAQDSGFPTPVETPTLQNSEAPVDAADDAGSLVPEWDSHSQDHTQLQPDGEAEFNAHTPAGLSDMPTPAPDSAAPSRNPSPEPVIESIRKHKARNQYSCARIRTPTDFVNALEDYKEMADEDLFNVLEASANALEAWQNEWKKQKLITEDEDNAVRRRAHDASLMAREARDMAKTSGAISIEKRDFEIKGLRANRVEENKLRFPKSNPDVYERNQDQIAAQAWGFEWDPRPSMISKQDPIAQRDGLQNNRLRNRPKPSQRAADAAVDEPAGIITGKRTRKPRVLSEESKEPSRPATPVEPVKPKQTRRRRKNVEAENNDSDNEAPAAGDDNAAKQAEAPEPPAPEQPVKKRRGPKPGAKAAREAEARAAAEREAAERAAAQGHAATDAANGDEEMNNAEETKQIKTRKRRRGGAAAAEARPEEVPAASVEDAHQQQQRTDFTHQQGNDVSVPAPKRQRNRKSGAGPKAEIPTAAFYSATSSAPTNDDTVTPTEDFRPSTSSSTSSMHTVGSSYSFRNRPRKNYSEMADPIKDVRAETRPKRGRKPKKEQEPMPTSVPSNFSQGQFDGAHFDASPFAPPNNGYSHQQHQHQPQPGSVLALPNNPFINLTGGGPGPLIAPAPARSGPTAPLPPHPVGANPFSAPHSNIPVEHPPQPPQSPRKNTVRIRLVNRRGQNATPQPTGPPPAAAKAFPTPPAGHHAPLAPLQPPAPFHGHAGYEPHPYGGGGGGGPMPPQHSMPGAGPGQFNFSVNASPGTMSMPPMMGNAHPMPHMGPGSLPPNTSRSTSKAPGSGRATPEPSSAASSNGGAQGEEGMSEKDYASMTKSEKMSASMKARWANGSMRQAVNKRKETLARKKQKQSEDKVGGQTSTPATPQPESQSQTPGPITGLPNLPPGVAATSAAAQPSPTMPPQQPPREYGEPLHLVGSADYAPIPVPGVRGPSPRPMGVHDERHQAQAQAQARSHAQAQVQGYYQDGPHAQHMPFGGGYGQYYSNGAVDERNGGPAAPGWGPQN
ncbi:hypothetical protein VSDG_03046 [Cytospora chrysosperma]|uniref:Uncharacterized protein n=1 Tax=Cytospora chrysosperma TaxID=252740 RepID=A0A423W8J6_CYTCH|nr:hypothetical protein VSDG_03046 [Valsa sordida]